MPKHSMDLQVDLPYEQALAAARQSAGSLNLKPRDAGDSEGGALGFKEPFRLLSMSWPATLHVKLAPDGAERTSVAISGSIGGLGPVQSGHLKKQMNRFADGMRAYRP
jgi:hypothetical protein